MTLRQQKKNGGREIPWSIENLATGLAHFYKEHERYPTATEVDSYVYLPSARSIERRFGGLVALRAQLKLGTEHDFRSGTHSSKRAHTINKRAYVIEKKVYEFLCKRFGKEFVHREYLFTDDHRTRADFFIYDKRGGFCVDVFYPSDRRNLTGCLNSKQTKYATEIMRQYPVIFLQMNEDITDKVLEQLIENKDKKLPKGQHLMGWKIFESFCGSRTPLAILKGR
ncbi:MAG: hypothetical protein AAB947_01770 [Patescibacteria group bacterium]